MLYEEIEEDMQAELAFLRLELDKKLKLLVCLMERFSLLFLNLIIISYRTIQTILNQDQIN